MYRRGLYFWLNAMNSLLGGVVLIAAWLTIGISISFASSFGKRDVSANFWLAGFALDGLSLSLIYLTVFHGLAFGAEWATVTHCGAALLCGESLRQLDTGAAPGPRLVVIGLGASAVWLLLIALTSLGAIPASRPTINSAAAAASYGWAIWSTWRLWSTQRSAYLTQILVLLAMAGIIWGLRAVLTAMGITGPLWAELVAGRTAANMTVVLIFLLSLTRMFCYFGVRLDQLRRRAEREAQAVREQSHALGRRYAEIAAAMYSVPGCCIVTDAGMRVVYANAEANRLLSLDLQKKRPRLDTLIVDAPGATFGELARRHQVRVKAANSDQVISMNLSAKVTEDEGAAVQYVFLLQPAT